MKYMRKFNRKPSNHLVVLLSVNEMKSIEHFTGTPSLGFATVVCAGGRIRAISEMNGSMIDLTLTAVSSVIVLKLRKTTPFIGSDVFTMVQHPLGDVVQSQLGVL
jgi:hypothetical protein